MTPEQYDNAEELSPGLWLFRPGELVTPPKGYGSDQPPDPVPGNGPLDTPPPPPVRLIGRRKVEVNDKGGGG